jgi:glutamine amidotransferase
VAVDVSILEFGVGNVRSVVNACARAGGNPAVVSDGRALAQAQATRILLPGVGAVGLALENFRGRGFEAALGARLGNPAIRVLGICVGMQMLARSCSEFGTHAGLSLVDGTVERIDTTPADGTGPELRLPHVGWNEVETIGDDPLFRGIGRAHFYFLHSFALRCPAANVVGTAEYGRPVVAAIRNGRVAGVQFHPEKSSGAGEALLANFLRPDDDA